jgi:hypothetical protein
MEKVRTAPEHATQDVLTRDCPASRQRHQVKKQATPTVATTMVQRGTKMNLHAESWFLSALAMINVERADDAFGC